MTRSASRWCTSALLPALLVVFSGAAQAQPVLYGAATGTTTGNAPSSLYTIDPMTGMATLVGPIGFDAVSGMAILPDGRLVGSANGSAIFAPQTAILIEIDRATGAGTLIGVIDDTISGNCGRMPDLTYDAASDTLYGYADFCVLAPEGLYTIDPATGAGMQVGPSGYTGGGNGLAADAAGTLYGTPFDISSLVIFDPMTGAGMDVPGSAGNVPFRVNALDFHPETGMLYGSWNDSNVTWSLVTIDTADGTATVVGASVQGLDALVFERMTFQPPPFPTDIPTQSGLGLALLALLLAAAAFWALRQRA